MAEKFLGEIAEKEILCYRCECIHHKITDGYAYCEHGKVFVKVGSCKLRRKELIELFCPWTEYITFYVVDCFGVDITKAVI